MLSKSEKWSLLKSSGLEERFFVFSGLDSVFLLSQFMSDMARVGRNASSWRTLDGRVSAYLQVVMSAFRPCFSAVHMSSALHLPGFRLSLFITKLLSLATGQVLPQVCTQS